MVFKNDNQFRPFSKALEIHLRACNFERVLTEDGTNVAAGDDELLWDEQLKFVDTIFCDRLKTFIAKTAYDKVENKHKPHVVWQEILKYYKKIRYC